jgi:hypothetical protein
VTRQQVRFKGNVLEGSGIEVTENNTANQRMFQDSFAIWAHEQLERERRSLGKLHTKRIPAIPLPQLKQQVRAIAGQYISINSLSADKRQSLLSLARLQTHLGSNFMAQLGATHRTAYIPGRHHAHRGWLPGHKRKRD